MDIPGTRGMLALSVCPSEADSCSGENMSAWFEGSTSLQPPARPAYRRLATFVGLALDGSMPPGDATVTGLGAGLRRPQATAWKGRRTFSWKV